ncbi:hypothetical protein, partial [Enterococcus faecalis]|uniref:hypothetical protein n=2 Tax=Enterococcus TaxID=1350 RepID=UPI0025578BFE
KQVVEKAKSGVAFGAGVIKQSLSNNGIILPINSRLSRWLEQDWIKQNPAYNTGVFIGQLAGLAQAAAAIPAMHWQRWPQLLRPVMT